MGINFAQNWPVYILLGLVLWFFIYVIISGNKKEGTRKESQKEERIQDKK